MLILRPQRPHPIPNTHFRDATQVLGEPNVYPKHAVDNLGYCFSTADPTSSEDEWIELLFEEEVFVTSVEVFETWAASSVVKISTAAVYEDDNSVAVSKAFISINTEL